MGRVEVLIEVYVWPVRVLILGGGHVAVSLSKILDFLEIPYSVADDRSEFANRDNFLHAADIINELPHKALKKYKADDKTYIVIVTRGHSYDESCLRESLKTDACYIGMIGSRSKVKEIFKRLNREKLYPQKDKRVYSPIGLVLGGKTPNEIAISIASEILCVSYKTKPGHMREAALI
jgi:xanthine dehydrogenase accessory factor